MLAFNFFFLPPLYTFTLADSRNWFALRSSSSRRWWSASWPRARVGGRASRRCWRGSRPRCSSAARCGASWSGSRPRRRGRCRSSGRAIALGEPAAGRREAYPLSRGAARVGTIYLARSRRGDARARRRLLPALASLLGVAIDRERLAREALEAEALRRSDVIKTALLRAVSHDLRTPLMAILTSAGALARRDFALGDDGPRASCWRRSSARPTGSTVWSATCSTCRGCRRARREPEPELVAVDDLVVEALDELGEDGERGRGVAPGRAAAGARRRAPDRSVCSSNLLENALKYSPAGRAGARPASRHARRRCRPGDRPRPGVAPDERERIFEPFQRGAAAATVRGAGLGLAIARGFAEANGGRVWVESRAGQGATFVLALPRRCAGRGRRRERGRACWSSTTSSRSCARCGRACGRRLRGRDRRDRRRGRSPRRRCSRPRR